MLDTKYGVVTINKTKYYVGLNFMILQFIVKRADVRFVKKIYQKTRLGENNSGDITEYLMRAELNFQEKNTFFLKIN